MNGNHLPLALAPEAGVHLLVQLQRPGQAVPDDMMAPLLEVEAVAGGSGDNCLGDGVGVCYYVGWSTEGPDGWVCDDPLGGTLAGCVWLGVTIA